MLAKSGVRRNALHRRSRVWWGRLLLAIAMIVALLLPQMAQPTRANPDTTIDDFDDTMTVEQVGEGSISDYIEGSMLGSERDVIVTVTETGGGTKLTVQINAGSSSKLGHSQGSGVKGTTEIQWDGTIDDGATTVDYDGLGTQDLTNSDSDNAFIIGLIESDADVEATITVYSGDDQHCSSLAKTLPEHDAEDLERATIFPFNGFDAACTYAATFSSVGAVVLEIDGTASPNADVTIDLLKTGVVDYGDLPGGDPEDYANTLLADDGAGHVVGSTLYLGSTIDGEADGQEDSEAGMDATGGDDNGDTDDEDGVAPTSGVTWQQGENGGSVDVTVVGTGCLNGWIDWNQDGYFWHSDHGTDVWDNGEYVIQNATTGSGTYTFDIPVDPSGETFYARFRVLPQQDSSCVTLDPYLGYGAKRQYLSGEVEDYMWSFSPTAVTLARLDVTSVSSRSPVGAAAAVLAFLAGSVVVSGMLMRRRWVR